MVKQSFTAVVERAQGLGGAFATEPYEAGWAGEALVFIKVLRLDDGAALEARVQVSPDGIEWADEGAVFAPISAPGLYFVKLANFGSWLRVAGEVAGSGATADIVVSLALKE